jgi:hypothetical protein
MNLLRENKNRTCEHCGEKILGRSDKRFCSDYCRNSQHNLENRDNSNYMRKVNNLLRKNRRILAKFNPNGKAKILGTALMEEGFNFAYFTNIYETKKGGKYYFCYDQGYIQIEDGYYALVVRESYVK